MYSGEQEGDKEISKEEFFAWAKKRAETYLEKNELKTAVNSIVDDLRKDKTRDDDQKEMIAMMGVSLNSKDKLTKEDVVEFINGFSV